MTDISVNPLFAPRRTAQTTAKAGGYLGLAMTAWLATAVATGYGVSIADTGESTSSSNSSSSSAGSSGSSGSSPLAGPSRNSSASVPGSSSGSASGSESDTPTAADPKADGSKDSDGTSDESDSPSSPDDSEFPSQESPTGDDTTADDDSADGAGSDETDSGQGTNGSGSSDDDDASTVMQPAKPGPGSYSAEVGTTKAVLDVTSATGTTPASDSDTAPVTPSDDPTTTPVVSTPAPAAPTPGTDKLTLTTAQTEAIAPSASPNSGGPLGFLNHIVTQLLNPFLADAPNSPEPFSPALWAVLAWVRRNVFNQAPTLNPTTTVQAGQTVSGTLGAFDAEGDKLKYKIVEGPKFGTVTIDQATGTFTYTPDDIDYEAIQVDSFKVSATDGKANLLSLFTPRAVKSSVDVSVFNPTIERVILDMPEGITNPMNPRFAADGKSILFHAQPNAGGRRELYQINVDGTNAQCLTCGVSPEVTANLGKMTAFLDGSGRVLVEAGNNKWVVYESDINGKRLVPIVLPQAGATVLPGQASREMRISPDGTHVVFTQIQLGQGGVIAAVPIVGKFDKIGSQYVVSDARVIFHTGEAKNWTHDGKGVIILGGQYDAGNVDDIVVDMETGAVYRMTANLDYDEDTDMSPNGQWIAIGSMRGLDALTPMTRIVRPAFLPAYIQGAVYEAYANPVNVTNQEWLVAIEDDLKGENGIPLFVDGDGYTARSMPGWSPNGDAVTFFELDATDRTQTRLVIANLRYTTSVGTIDGDNSTPSPDWAPALNTYVPTAPPLPATGSYAGAGGGTAVVTAVADPTTPGNILRTVTYTDYVNEKGMILNGSETTSENASQNLIRYTADITVTGANTGWLRGDVTIDKTTRKINAVSPGSMITSELDGDVLVLLDPARIDDSQVSA